MFSQSFAASGWDCVSVGNCLSPGFNVDGTCARTWFARQLQQLAWLQIGDPERGAGIIVRLAVIPPSRQ